MYIKKHGLLFQPDHQWEIDQYGIDMESKGDCISNTMMAILRGEYLGHLGFLVKINKAEATDMILSAGDLLLYGERWPDCMNTGLEANNWLQFQWSRWMFKLGVNETRLYRSQRSITKDPIIYLYCAQHKIWGDYYPVNIRFPWWTYRPAPFAWRKYLITGEDKYKRRYEFWEAISIKIALHRENGKIKWGLPEFALRMSKFMGEAAGSEKILKMLG